MSKPSVNDPNMRWALLDVGRPTFGYDGDYVVLYQQVPLTGKKIEHYRFSVNDKWHRKTFYGETAWHDVERYILDHYHVDITA